MREEERGGESERERERERGKREKVGENLGSYFQLDAYYKLSKLNWITSVSRMTLKYP